MFGNRTQLHTHTHRTNAHVEFAVWRIEASIFQVCWGNLQLERSMLFWIVLLFSFYSTFSLRICVWGWEGANKQSTSRLYSKTNLACTTSNREERSFDMENGSRSWCVYVRNGLPANRISAFMFLLLLRLCACHDNKSMRYFELPQNDLLEIGFFRSCCCVPQVCLPANKSPNLYTFVFLFVFPFLQPFAS